MDVFNLRVRLIEDYQNYVESFIHVPDGRICGKVEGELDGRAAVVGAAGAIPIVDHVLRRGLGRGVQTIRHLSK